LRESILKLRKEDTVKVHDSVAVMRCISGLLAAILVASVSACARIVRDATYRETTTEFRRATPREAQSWGQSRVEDYGWRFDVTLPDGRTVATISAPGHIGSPTIKYSDESRERRLYTYRVYSITSAIRIDGTRLYVLWLHSLFRVRHWLLVYDLEARKPILKRRVDPQDVGHAPRSRRRAST